MAKKSKTKTPKKKGNTPRQNKPNPQPTNAYGKPAPSQMKMNRPMKTNMDHSDVHEAVCSLTDPFCKHANGVRLPDAANVRSLPFQLHARRAVTCDANGSGALLFCPGYNFQVALATFGGTANATTTVFDASLNGTGIVANSFRIVNWGVIARNTSPALTTQGMWRIRGLSNLFGSAINVINTGNYNVDWAEDEPVSAAPELHIVPKRFNAASSNNYVDVSQINPTINVTDWVSPGWQALLVCVFNGAASQTFECELIINYELTFDDGNAISTVAKPSVPDNFPLRQAQSHVESAVPPVHKERDNYDKVMKELAGKAAKKVGHKVIKDGMTALEKYMG